MAVKGNLLIVDDEPDVIELLQRQLENRSYKVHTALSGQEALTLLNKHADVDILITDVRMPGMDGLELIKGALKVQPGLQTIVITGHGDFDTALAAMRLGAFNYLRKPIGIAELAVTITNCMDKIRLQRLVEEKQRALHLAHGELEKRVAERTAELETVNASLQEEVTRHKKTAADLREKDEQLRHA